LLLPGEERYHDRQQEEDDAAEAGRWGLCHMPLCGTASAPPAAEGAGARTPSGSGAKVIRSLLPTRRRLRLDPPAKLYFPCTPRRTENSALAICPRETRASWLSIDFLDASCWFLEKNKRLLLSIVLTAPYGFNSSRVSLGSRLDFLVPLFYRGVSSHVSLSFEY
jgi:hypothetical protein